MAVGVTNGVATVKLRLLRRRLSVSAPRMIVRSHLPWPLRWLVIALMFGLSAAVALWAFEFGKIISGVDTGAKEEVLRLRDEIAQLRVERDRAVSVANTAENLLRTEAAAQERLAQQLRTAEGEILALKGDLGFFERLLPTAGGDDLTIRGLQAEPMGPGRMRLQLLVIQPGRNAPEFSGRYSVSLSGTMDGKPWSYEPQAGQKDVKLKQYVRVDDVLEHPAEAVIQLVQVRIVDAKGATRASQALKL